MGEISGTLSLTVLFMSLVCFHVTLWVTVVVWLDYVIVFELDTVVALKLLREVSHFPCLLSVKWTQEGGSDQQMLQWTAALLWQKHLWRTTRIASKQTCQVLNDWVPQPTFTFTNLTSLTIASCRFKGKPCKWCTGLAKRHLNLIDIRNCVLFSLWKDKAVFAEHCLFKLREDMTFFPLLFFLCSTVYNLSAFTSSVLYPNELK